jgi:hypothetical protein
LSNKKKGQLVNQAEIPRANSEIRTKNQNWAWAQFLFTPKAQQQIAIDTIKAQFKSPIAKPNPNWPPKYPKPTLYMHPPHPRTVSISSAVTSVIYG